MGLRNAPVMFIWTMSNLFMDMLDKVVVFLDNMLIYINIAEKYFKLLKKVFTCISMCSTAI